MSIALELIRRWSPLLAALAALSGCGGSAGGGSGLSLSPGSLTFSAVQGGPAPAAQAIQVTAGHPDVYYVVAGYPVGASEPAWLAMDLEGAGSPWTLRITVSDTSLAPGSYSATVRVVVARQDESVIAQQDAQVTYTVRTGVAASPSSLEFRYVVGGSETPSPQTVALSGTSGLGWSASADRSWIALGSGSGTVPGTTSVAVDPTGLGLGTHQGTVTLAAGGSTTPVPVTLTVATPTLSAAPASIALGGPGGHDLASKDIQLSLDTGANDFTWSVSGTPSWLQLSPSSGAVSGTPVAITLSPVAASLGAGSYSATLTFTAQVNGNPVSTTLPVTLGLDAHKLLASDVGVAFASTPALSRLARAVKVRSNRGLAASWSAVSSASWLTATASGTTADDLVLTADPTGLASDTLHQATVSIGSSDATITGSETIRVGLWVGSTTPDATTTVGLTYQEIAADPVRPYAYVHNRGTDVAVYNVYTGAQVGTIAGVGAALGDMAISADGSRLFVADDANDAIVPVDLDAGVAGTPWPLAAPDTWSRLAYARPNGTGVVLASDGRVYDASTGGRHAATFSPPPGDGGGAVLSSSRDGSRFCAINGGYSPYTLSCFPLDWNGETAQIVIGASKGGGGGSNGKDVALSADGSRVYVASGAPYTFGIYDATASGSSMPSLGSLAGAPYPNAVEVGPDGRVHCGASVSLGSKDVWIYDGAGALQSDYLVSGLRDRQLAVSGDGLRMMALTNAALKIITAGP